MKRLLVIPLFLLASGCSSTDYTAQAKPPPAPAPKPVQATQTDKDEYLRRFSQQMQALERQQAEMPPRHTAPIERRNPFETPPPAVPEPQVVQGWDGTAPAQDPLPPPVTVSEYPAQPEPVYTAPEPDPVVTQPYYRPEPAYQPPAYTPPPQSYYSSSGSTIYRRGQDGGLSSPGDLSRQRSGPYQPQGSYDWRGPTAYGGSYGKDQIVRRKDGTTYHRTKADGNPFNNYSTKHNRNPFTGRKGYVNPYRSRRR